MVAWPPVLGQSITECVIEEFPHLKEHRTYNEEGTREQI
jgi:hypothetical protein